MGEVRVEQMRIDSQSVRRITIEVDKGGFLQIADWVDNIRKNCALPSGGLVLTSATLTMAVK